MDKIVLMSNQEEKVGSTTFLFFFCKIFSDIFQYLDRSWKSGMVVNITHHSRCSRKKTRTLGLYFSPIWRDHLYIGIPEIQSDPQSPGSSRGLDFQKCRWCQNLEGPWGRVMGRREVWSQEQMTVTSKSMCWLVPVSPEIDWPFVRKAF